jgi:hypothetical protein
MQLLNTKRARLTLFEDSHRRKLGPLVGDKDIKIVLEQSDKV